MGKYNQILLINNKNTSLLNKKLPALQKENYQNV
jgi:hypothetical protein